MDKKQLTEQELEKKALESAFNDFYKNKQQDNTVQATVPNVNITAPENFQSTLQKETDPDLIIGYESVKLPSKGFYYSHKIDTVDIEYLTSKDEDILSTPSLIENGTVMDVILRRKIKTPGIKPEELLTGDKSALVLFLRASSYGYDYEVQVPDPRTGVPFKEVIDLSKLSYKQNLEKPDEKGQFVVEIPKRKKIVKFRLLTSGEEEQIMRKAKSYQEAYNQQYSEYNTMKLKAHIVEIEGKVDKSYIDRFVDAMPALDAYTIRRKILDVMPDIDMTYEFTAKDGYKFKANLTMGVDFFFPNP